MSRAELIVTAVVEQHLSQAEAARTYGVSEATVSRLVTRYRRDGPAAFQPQSRAPHTHPGATSQSLVDAVLAERGRLTTAGLDAGGDTIIWRLRGSTACPRRRTSGK